MNTPLTLTVSLLLAWPTLGAAQTLYRCGNTYSQTPCAADATPARISAGAAPDAAQGPQGAELCSTQGVAALRFPDPESTRVVAITKSETEAIKYAGQTVAARKYLMTVNTRNGYGAYSGERNYLCYLSEDERRVLKLEAARR